MNARENDFYQKLRWRLKEWIEKEKGGLYKWSKWLLLAPDLFHLLVRLMADPDVPMKEKTKVVIVIAYFISPIDFLPEVILGPTGFLDDVVLSAYALNGIVNNVDIRIVQKHWAGDGNILEIIQKILSLADRMLGSGLYKRIRNLLK
jgi:uncharacterized membrane protein YkvA (DUF1232 family)